MSLKAQGENGLDDRGKIVAVGKTERRQKRDGVSAQRAEKTLDPDNEKSLFVTSGPSITAMPHKRFCCCTMGTISGRRKREMGKLALIMLDILAEICDNDHTVDGA